MDTDRKKLYINAQEYAITKMDFNLLCLFLNAPNHFLTREEIKQTFWPKEVDPNDKVNSHINTLRRILKKTPGYDLATEKGVGYYLLLP